MSTAKITATNYSAILSTVTSVLTTYYGYGQASKSIVAGNRITAADWQNLYSDINHALVHQTDVGLPFPTIQSGSVLTEQFVNSLTNYVVQINANKTSIGSNQLSYEQTLSTRSTAWGSNIVHQTKFVWSDATAAQSFFNQGGYLLATIARTVNAGTKAENIAWSNLIFNAVTLLNGSPQLVKYRLTEYNGSYGGYSYTDATYSIDFAYTKISASTILGTITFNTNAVNGISIDVLPSAGFREYQSTNIYGGTFSPGADAIPVISLDVGGASLYPALIYTPFASTTVPQLEGATVRTVTITNTGTGICHISGATFFGQSGSGVSAAITLTTSTLALNSSTNILLDVNTLNAIRGTYPNGYLEVYSDSITGSTMKVKMPMIVGAPSFQVNLSPNPVTVSVVDANPVITHFSFSAGNRGNIYSVTASITGGGGRVGVTGLNPKAPTYDVTVPSGAVYDNLLYTTFIPPTSNVLGDVVGTYSATLTVTFTPYDYTQSAFTVTVPLTYNVNIPNRHLGNWLSPKDIDNGVFGASYDIINGVRTLTLGFGMGQDGSPPLNRGGSTYATASTLGINGDPYPSLGIPLFPATNSTKYGDFLNQYGSWPTVNGGGGHQSTFDLTYTVNMPAAGYYASKLAGVSTSVLYVNGNQISTTSDPKGVVTTNCYLNAGNNTIRIITTSAGGRDKVVGYWTVYKTPDGVEVKREWTEEVPGVPWLGSVAVTLTDSNGNLRWSTRHPVRTAYAYWAEVCRIPLTQGKHLYKSGDYLVKTNDFAMGRNYGSWLGINEYAGSAFIVVDDGNGNITISMNPWEAKKSTGDQELNRTLAYSVALPYYYSQLSTRFSQLGPPLPGGKTQFFVGFKNSGAVDTRKVLFPYPYTPPPDPANPTPPGEEPRTFWANLVVALEIAAVAFVAAVVFVAAVEIYFGATVAVAATFAVLSVVETILVFAAAVCFTKDSKISMADGTVKPICEVNVGDLVLNYNKTSINRVTYIEKTTDLAFGHLFSVTKDEEPFATVNHPLYINGKLSTVYPDKTYEYYPWLGKLESLNPDRIIPANGQDVYNLLTTGDGTYIVNGYGTISIQGDGGWGRLLVEQGITSPERLNEVLLECATESKEISYGAYVCNKALGKLDIKFINKIFGKIMDSKENTRSRRAIKYMFKTVGRVAVYFAERKMRK